MGMTHLYEEIEPAMEEVQAWKGPAVLEFGAPWCGHCQAAQALMATPFAAHPRVRHVKVEDGKGKPLGRGFGVKLWPTLVFLKNGKEVARLVRPTDEDAIARALGQISVA